MNNIRTFIQKQPALSIVVGFQLFRLGLLPFMGLMPQDAYYHFYGEQLALSYFDHPGMIGYILRIFTDVNGRFCGDFSDAIEFLQISVLFFIQTKVTKSYCFN